MPTITAVMNCSMELMPYLYNLIICRCANIIIYYLCNVLVVSSCYVAILSFLSLQLVIMTFDACRYMHTYIHSLLGLQSSASCLCCCDTSSDVNQALNMTRRMQHIVGRAWLHELLYLLHQPHRSEHVAQCQLHIACNA